MDGSTGEGVLGVPMGICGNLRYYKFQWAHPAPTSNLVPAYMSNLPSTNATSKKFASVSLPAGLADSLKEQAAIQGRTIATQIEHWAIIGRAVESVLPAPAIVALKSGQDAGEIMSRISAYLLHQQPALLIGGVAQLEAGKSPRYGVDPKDSSVAIRIEPDGTETRGRWDVAGNFIATSDRPS